MKRICLTLSFLLATTLLWAQKAATPKTGWVFLPLPDISYNSDVGLNLGVYSDIFYYGDGTVYPNFHHHIAVAGAYATKGSWYLHGLFDSSTLIPGVRLTASLSYRDALANNFFGFNGIASPYDANLDRNKVTRTSYYTNHRQVIRAAAVIRSQKKGRINWMGGLVFRHIRLEDFHLSHYDSGNSLYLAYQSAGLIRADEAGGGTSLELRGGAIYDTRDVEMRPSRGMYAELYVNGNLDLSHGKYHYAQLVAHFRHFIPLWANRMVLGYHVGLQHQFIGEMPFYNLPELSTLTYQYEEFEGLGSRYTFRGLFYNRILAPGLAWSNIELRTTVLDFNFRKQRITLVLFPFVDLGVITRTYRLEEQKSLPGLYQDRNLPVIVSAGIGGKLHINANISLGIDLGKSFDPQLGGFTISTGSVYMF